MKISLIVPAFNEAGLLGESLARIQESALVLQERGWSTELIVCDNNSTDATAEIAEGAGAHVVFEPINQIARARNRGAEAATGDWLWFIDADSQPSAKLFAAAADEISRGQVVAVGTTLQFENVDLAFRFAASIWKAWSLLWSHMAGSFIVVEAGAFRAIGGFSHEYFAGEELDLSVRLRHWGKLQSQRRKVKVLRGVPLLTSGRKARLYTWRESLRFLVRTMWSPFGTLKKRDACFIWYDGRRE
jgi:glycosyltransferase involved in cell wall biosynthesis